MKRSVKLFGEATPMPLEIHLISGGFVLVEALAQSKVGMYNPQHHRNRLSKF
jgi:hypothetical protein